MITQEQNEMTQAYRDLMAIAHPVDRQTMQDLLDRDTDAASKVIQEMSRIMMGAKCLAISPDDRNFIELCGELVVLSMTHAEVRPIFKWVSKYDLAHGDDDKLANPDELALTHERVERVLQCLA